LACSEDKERDTVMDRISLKEMLMKISGFKNSVRTVHRKASKIVRIELEGPKTYTVQISRCSGEYWVSTEMIPHRAGDTWRFHRTCVVKTADVSPIAMVEAAARIA
jgi:hypothetical protein